MLRNGFKRKFLFFLSFCADIYSEISVRGFYRKLYAPGYQAETVTQFLSRMSKVGEIERKVINGRVVFKITAKGEKLLDEVIPLQKLGERTWDGWWRIVIFDIEEKDRYLRDRVREKLLDLGFGKWQESVYICPHPVQEEINEYFQEKKLYPRCICLEARKTGVEDDQLLAEEVFDLNSLVGKYGSLAEEINKTDKLIDKKEIKKSEAMNRLRSYMEKFETFLLTDPFLPKELFRDYLIRGKTQKAIIYLAKKVAKTI